MNRRSFWSGFAWGAAAIIGGGFVAARLRQGSSSRILRLEKSIQIASPLEDVFATWSDFEQLSRMSKMITNVHTFGHRSRWTLNINGVPVQWEAETTQVIPYEAIGWKSLSGPKHSGRITFSRIGSDTLLHVQMNYAPPLRMLRPLLSSFSGDLEGYIERALREFKAGMEARVTGAHQPAKDAARSTGTYGSAPGRLAEQQTNRFGAPSTPMESVRPPEAKS
jgi:uncharacterized membrane protein